MTVAVFQTRANGNAIVEFILHSHCVLSYHIRGPDAAILVLLTIVSVDDYWIKGRIANIEIAFRLLAHEKAELRSQLYESLETASLTSPSQTGEQGHLDIIHLP